MTEIEKKALALVNDVLNERGNYTLYAGISRASDPRHEALCRAIEQHEAYKQEVSDAVYGHFGTARISEAGVFRRFVLAKPDPLVEAVGEAMQEHEVYSKYELTESLHKALAKRGLKIVETGR